MGQVSRVITSSVLAIAAFVMACTGLLWIIAYAVVFILLNNSTDVLSGILRESSDPGDRIWLLVVFSGIPLVLSIASALLDCHGFRKRSMVLAATVCLSLFTSFA